MDELLKKTYEPTAAVLAAVTSWDAPSPCAGWTVREVAAHLVEVMHVFAAAIDGGPAGPYAGDDLAGEYRVAADRCLAAFARPGALTTEHPFPPGPTEGAVIAQISLSESLVHGWDVAKGAGLPYTPSPEAVQALSVAKGEPPEGAFADPLEPADDAPLTVLLARLGRKA